MIKIDKFYDCLLRNNLPNGRIYVKEESDDLLTKISKILNTEIYTMLRNNRCFASRRRPTAMGKIMEEKFKDKKKYKRVKKRNESIILENQNVRVTEKPSIDNLISTSDTLDKVLTCIKKTRIFNIIFTSGDRTKAALYRSANYGAIFSKELFQLIQNDNPYLMISPEDIGEDYQKLLKYQPPLSNSDLSQNYIYATFMPPGDTKTIITYGDIQDTHSYNLLESIIPPHSQELILHEKRVKKKLIIRQFQKHLSVFKDWIPDTEHSLSQALEVDFNSSRLKKFIKDEEEYKDIYNLFVTYIVKIKEIFVHSVGMSSYPYISWLEFCKLAEIWKIPDKATCSMRSIDTIFIATNFEEVDTGENPDKSLCRYEFYEIIVRIAYEKYYVSKTERNLPRAVSRLLTENIFKNSNFVLSGQQWREDYLWSVNIDDLYKANTASLKAVFEMIRTKRTTILSLPNALHLCDKQLDINIEIQNIKLAFSLSKMTLINEMEESDKLDQLEYVEYLEFIARIGQIVFIKNKTMRLYDKVFYIMQKLFKLVPAKVKVPETDFEVESESDNDEYD